MNPEPLAEPEPEYLEPPPLDPETFAIAAHRAYRRANRPFRRAFRGIFSGELDRKILAAVGVSNAKAAER
jgi:hypothetical protein